MKTEEEKKNPETHGEIAREDIEIDLEKDGDKIIGGKIGSMGFKHIEFKIEQGDVRSIIGASGCGKSKLD